jgi:hypothetical protein
MILIGVACTYLAIVITCVSILEIIIKVIEVILQKINQTQNKGEKANPYVMANDKVIKCNINNNMNNSNSKMAIFDFEAKSDENSS